MSKKAFHTLTSIVERNYSQKSLLRALGFISVYSIVVIFSEWYGYRFEQPFVIPTLGMGIIISLVYGVYAGPVLLSGWFVCAVLKLVFGLLKVDLTALFLESVVAMIAAFLITRTETSKAYNTEQVVVSWLVWGVLIAPAMISGLVTIRLILGDLAPASLDFIQMSFGSQWRAYALGVIIWLGPVVAHLSNTHEESFTSTRFGIWATTLLVACLYILTDSFQVYSDKEISPNLLFLVMVWGVYFVGNLVLTLGLGFIYLSVMGGFLLNIGYFSKQSTSLNDAWFFLVTLTLTTIVFALSNRNRERVEWQAASGKMYEQLQQEDVSLSHLLQMQCQSIVQQFKASSALVYLHADERHSMMLISNRGEEQIQPNQINRLREIVSDTQVTTFSYQDIVAAEMLQGEPLVKDEGFAAVSFPLFNFFQHPVGMLWVFFSSRGKLQLVNMRRLRIAAHQCSLLAVRKRIDDTFRLQQQQINHERSILMSLMNSNPDVIFVKDYSGRYIFCNPAFEALAGLSQDEIIGKSYADVFDEKYKFFIEETDLSVMQNSPTYYRDEVWLSHPDGTKILFDVIKAPLKDMDGQIIGIVGLGRDITENRSLESEIVSMTENQQNLVGRELHDGVGQKVVGVTFRTAHLQQQLKHHPNDHDNLNRELSFIHQQLMLISDEIRQLARGLVPFEINSHGLASGLSDLAKNISESSMVDCAFHSHGNVDISDMTLSLHLYRIVQELTNNILRHADARKIEIILAIRQGKYVLIVRDDGKGIDEQFLLQQKQSGVGFKTMRYRASIIHADMEFENLAEGGLEVRILFVPPE